MKERLSEKAAGFYFLVIAAVAAVVALVRYAVWAPGHNAMDMLIIAALVLGIAADIVLFVKDNDYVTVAATVFYSIAAVKILTDSVGSFVDAFQGISMFGDASQVGTIISISAIAAVSVVASIIAGFLKRVKE